MLDCMACSKQIGGCLHQHQQHEEEYDADHIGATPNDRKKHVIKTLTTHIKGMALKASSSVYKKCKPCSKSVKHYETDEYELSYIQNPTSSLSKRFNHGYYRSKPASKMMGTAEHASGETTPVASVSERRESNVVFSTEDEPKEWVAQVEPGVVISFVSVPQSGGNDLKRIRFSRELFNKRQAQRWWADNYDKLTELYNVRRFNQNTVHFPTPPPISENQDTKLDPSVNGSPATPPLIKESVPRTFHRYSPSDSLGQHMSHQYDDSYGLVSTPKVSNMSMIRTEASTSSVDASARSSFTRSDEVSVTSDVAEVETEWVEQDEPGVYITVRALPDGVRELRRVRFSRERFGEMQARRWWEDNKRRIQEQYL